MPAKECGAALRVRSRRGRKRGGAAENTKQNDSTAAPEPGVHRSRKTPSAALGPPSGRISQHRMSAPMGTRSSYHRRRGSCGTTHAAGQKYGLLEVTEIGGRSMLQVPGPWPPESPRAK